MIFPCYWLITLPPSPFPRFQQEWYELQQNGQVGNDIGKVPDEYVQNEKLREEMEYLRAQLQKSNQIAETAK